jgi:deoxyribodipyrimidine photolyase-related protein
VVGTKPYAASGKYVDRMSNFCGGCAYSVDRRTGDSACPFNTFYWDFLLRHRETFSRNSRMTMMLKNLDRIDSDEQRAIQSQADRMRAELGIGPLHARPAKGAEK